MKKIKLTQGKVALVDDDMFDELSKHKWCAAKIRNTFYAVRTIPDKTKKSEQRTICMHRVILAAKKDQLCDHIDRNGLNNMRSNLRFASRSLNMLNQRTPKNNTSGFKGVYWNKHHKRWMAQISINNKRKNLGLFDTAKKASAIYQKAYQKGMAELTI